MPSAIRQTTASPQASARSGWVTFAGVMFIVVGAFTLLDGIVALVNDDFLIADKLLFGNLSAWGVWWLFVGGVQVLTGIAILRRVVIVWIFGVALASLNALTQLMWMGAYPAWAVIAIVVDGLIIWALTTRIDEFV